MNFFFLFFLLSYLNFVNATEIRGVRKRDLSLYSGQSFTCLDKSKTIPVSYVNDQYCDCELDGSDEPGTSACSNGQFFCKNKGFRGNYIPSSRVNDGICDCCDGSDENPGRCSDQCAILGKEAQKDVLKEIEGIEEGLKIKQQWIEESRTIKVQKETELAELKKELVGKEAAVEAAKAHKLEEEEIEKAERERLQAIREAKKAEEEAAKNQTQESTQTENTEETAQGEQISTPPPPPAPATEGGDVQAEVGAFPYPQEYAFKPEEKQEGEAAFPYPKEYAAPTTEKTETSEVIETSGRPQVSKPVPITTQETIEDDHEEVKEEEGKDNTDQAIAVETKEEESEGVLQRLMGKLVDLYANFFGTETKERKKRVDLVSKRSHQKIEPEMGEYFSEAADKARKIYDDAENERRDIQSKIDKIEAWLKNDYGQTGEFTKLHDQCWSHPVRQYTYEVCPFDRAEQKESGRGTSLGQWKGFFDPSEISETSIKLEENMYNKVMKFDGGQTCWNGPARSLIVMLKCDSKTEVSQVEEPSKCVYTAVMKTPAVCSLQHAQALKLSLESGIFDEEE